MFREPASSSKLAVNDRRSLYREMKPDASFIQPEQASVVSGAVQPQHSVLDN